PAAGEELPRVAPAGWFAEQPHEDEGHVLRGNVGRQRRGERAADRLPRAECGQTEEEPAAFLRRARLGDEAAVAVVERLVADARGEADHGGGQVRIEPAAVTEVRVQ